jgi:N-acetyl-gamma-glutamyl-phosphate reductase
MAAEIVARGSALLDVGPDFRLHDPRDYPSWYNFDHPAPDLLARAVYGLPELHRKEMRAAAESSPTIIGLPGCYPTATILTLAPLARAGLIGDVAVDAKSGVSGAGREPRPDLLFSEVNESVKAYGMFNHRHTAEMEQELQQQGERGTFGSRDANPGVATVDFLPHLIPMTRGILASCHVRPTRPVTQAELDAIYEEAYGDEPFVQVVADAPSTKHVYGSNLCRIWVRVDPRSGRILALGVIDNLVKGAAGQAVQALNVLFGLPETTGLEQYPLNP